MEISNTKEALAEKIQSMLSVIQGSISDHGAEVKLLKVSKDKDITLRLDFGDVNCPEGAEAAREGIKGILRMKLPGINRIVYD